MVQNYEGLRLIAQPALPYEPEKDIYQKSFTQSSGKEGKVTVLIFPSPTV